MLKVPETKTDVRALFRRAFAHTPPKVVRVPGSLEFLGGYTESHGGLICATAVDRYVDFAIAPRHDGRVDLVVDRPSQRSEIWLREFVSEVVPGWAAPVAAIVRHLQELGANIRGFNAAVVNGIPQGIGLGEESSLSLATALGLRAAFGLILRDRGMDSSPGRLRREDCGALSRRQCHRLAEICQAGERSGGVGDGDWFRKVAPLLNLPYELCQHDAMHRVSESHPLVGDFALVIVDSGLRDSKRGVRRSHSELRFDSVAASLGLKRLRSANPDLLQQRHERMTPLERGGAWYWSGECARAVAIEKALAAGDLLQFGRYLAESHDDARRMAGLTVPELDLLVNLASAHIGCAAARFTGNATDGAILCLVRRSMIEDFVQRVTSRYERETGISSCAHVVNAVGGVMSGRD